MIDITSVHNPRLKAAEKLRDRRDRQRERRFLIDGPRELLRAIEAGIEVEELFLNRDDVDGRYDAVLESALAAGAKAYRTSPEAFAKVAFGERQHGLVAVCRMPQQRRLEELRLPEHPLVCVLEHVEKPGNVGAVARTADAAGISALLVADPAVDLYNPNAIRSSQGAMFTLPVLAVTSNDALAWLRSSGVAIYAARVDGAKNYADYSYRSSAAFILGSEAQGLSDAWRGPDIQAIRLPMLGRVDSLNVSVSAAVLFYEAVRQRANA